MAKMNSPVGTSIAAIHQPINFQPNALRGLILMPDALFIQINGLSLSRIMRSPWVAGPALLVLPLQP